MGKRAKKTTTRTRFKELSSVSLPNSQDESSVLVQAESAPGLDQLLTSIHERVTLSSLTNELISFSERRRLARSVVGCPVDARATGETRPPKASS